MTADEHARQRDLVRASLLGVPAQPNTSPPPDHDVRTAARLAAQTRSAAQ
jgi:hypothetical protein